MARYLGYETPSAAAPAEIAFEASVATAAPKREIQVGTKELMALACAGLLLTACGLVGDSAINTHTKGPKSPANATKECDVLDINANSAANPLRYESTASLPHDKRIDRASQTNNVVYGWFSNSGPYGGKADKGSLSIIDAVVVDGALDTGKALSTEAELQDSVQRHLDQYKTEQSRQVGISDCNNAYDVITQIAQYNPSAVHKGDHLEKLSSTRDSDNNINGLTETQYTAAGTMGGIELKYRDTAKNVKAGFNTVLVTSDGNMYIEGIVPTANKPTPSPTPTSGASKSHNNQGQAENNNANNGGSAGGGEHNGVTNGNTPEKNPNGPTQQKGTGGSGPTKETKKGTHNSPSGGNTGGGSKPVPSPRQTGPIGPSTGPGPGPAPTPIPTSGGGGGGNETTPPPENTPTSFPSTTTVSTPIPTPTPTKSGTDCDSNVAKC